MVQRCATQWIAKDYARTSIVILLRHHLGWQTLEERRSVARLCLFYKEVNGFVAVPLPDFIDPRYCHSMTFRQTDTGKDFLTSFY